MRSIHADFHARAVLVSHIKFIGSIFFFLFLSNWSGVQFRECIRRAHTCLSFGSSTLAACEYLPIANSLSLIKMLLESRLASEKKAHYRLLNVAVPDGNWVACWLEIDISIISCRVALWEVQAAIAIVRYTHIPKNIAIKLKFVICVWFYNINYIEIYHHIFFFVLRIVIVTVIYPMTIGIPVISHIPRDHLSAFSSRHPRLRHPGDERRGTTEDVAAARRSGGWCGPIVSRTAVPLLSAPRGSSNRIVIPRLSLACVYLSSPRVS